ncbi:hypothetical protein GGR56DRAFT_119959 [Xylariaceae sp. FL0804]|nr:hypothetical protein GGR56DRAFT_119959 [Xylariaceae sp. FL0804]
MSTPKAAAAAAAAAASDPYIGQTITAFEGGIIVKVIEHPREPARAFAYEVTFLLRHPRVVAVAALKPPLHFHPWQGEYIEVLSGAIAVEVDGVESVLTPAHGEREFPRWSHHRLYAPPTEEEEEVVKFKNGPALAAAGSDVDDDEEEEEEEEEDKTVLLLSGEASDEPFRLDTVFFQNWYAYQDQVVVKGERVDLIQVMSMFDAGGSYLSLPRWVPCGRAVARGLGVALGRWLGGLLGYQPFYRRWTSQAAWPLACRKMRQSRFQRRFAAADADVEGRAKTE